MANLPFDVRSYLLGGYTIGEQLTRAVLSYSFDDPFVAVMVFWDKHSRLSRGPISALLHAIVYFDTAVRHHTTSSDTPLLSTSNDYRIPLRETPNLWSGNQRVDSQSHYSTCMSFSLTTQAYSSNACISMAYGYQCVTIVRPLRGALIGLAVGRDNALIRGGSACRTRG